jgi:hypothetical protein
MLVFAKVSAQDDQAHNQTRLWAEVLDAIQRVPQADAD